MATAGDVRDIMDLGLSGPRPPAPKKKKKRLEPQVRLSGVTREVAALMGDSVPPIAIVEQKSYKSKPSIAQKLFKPRHWGDRRFAAGARDDGLLLHHWKRAVPGAARPHAITTPTDVEMSDPQKEEDQTSDGLFEDDFPADRFNVPSSVAKYTDEQYEAHFKSEEWTKEETDYLFSLCEEFTLRWLLIGDRYDTSEIPGDATYPDRGTEALKQRYYHIAAIVMESTTPANNMTATEFKKWETMRTFDVKNELQRKSNAEKLFERSREEAEEEKLLLEELARITKHEEEFIALRTDLYARLESAPAIRRTERGEEQPTSMYQNSHGLGMLLQQLLNRERKMRRPNPNEAAPASASEVRRPSQAHFIRRDTIESKNDSPAPQKKGSVSQAQVRNLTPAEESKYGVSHPTDKITSGVTFRHEKIGRLSLAKSQVQTSKITAALGELGIPARLHMPTERVTREYERLISNIHILLDARKVSEKVANEIKVLEEVRRQRLAPKDGEQATAHPADPNAMDLDKPDAPRTQDQTESDPKTDAPGAVDLSRKDSIADSSIMQVEDNAQSDAEGEDDDQSYADTARKHGSQAGDESDAEGEQDEEDEDAQDEEDEDADAELGEDEDDEGQAEVGEDDEEDEEGFNTLGKDDDDESNAAEAEEDSDGGAEVDDGDDDNGSDAAEDDEDGNEEEEEEEEDEDDTPAVQATPSDAGGEDEAEEEDAAPEPVRASSRPISSHSRSHKRSASVVSEASQAGSNRSGLGRKKRR